MAGRIEGKVAIITGGASGMGRDTALRFLREGAQVVIADMNEGTGKDTLELAAAEGFDQDIRFIRTDVSQESDIEAMVRHATDEFGRLDCIFNNAGLGGAMGKATEIEVDDWDFTFGVLVRGVFLGIKHAARVMQAQGEGGSLINTASVAGMTGGCGPVAYSASKAAGLSRARTRRDSEMARVLIADDASFMRQMIREIIEPEGFEIVAEAADGVEAVEQYELTRPDIVTMDIVMPKRSGIDAAKRLKNHQKCLKSSD